MTDWSDRDRQTYSDGLLLIARLFLAAVFLFSGVTKMLDWQGALVEFRGTGIPAPALAVAATVAIQLLAGLVVIVGWRVREAATLLVAFTVVATLIGHPFCAFEGIDFQRQLTTALEHLAIVGGFTLLALVGPGRFSIKPGEPEA